MAFYARNVYSICFKGIEFKRNWQFAVLKVILNFCHFPLFACNTRSLLYCLIQIMFLTGITSRNLKLQKSGMSTDSLTTWCVIYLLLLMIFIIQVIYFIEMLNLLHSTRSVVCVGVQHFLRGLATTVVDSSFDLAFCKFAYFETSLFKVLQAFIL